MPGSTRFNSESILGTSTAPTQVNVKQLNGTTVDTNSGNKSAGTLRVVLATDQPALTNKLLVTPDLPSGASTSANQANLSAVSSATISSLASSASSAQLIASNTSRKGLLLTNTDANAVYIKYGTTASATDFTVLIPSNYYWEMPQPVYTGRIDAIWAADGSGSLYYTEL
jgi:hypothetical protein